MSSFENGSSSPDESGERRISKSIRDELEKAPVIVSTPQQSVVITGEARAAGLTREGREQLGGAGTVPSTPIPSGPGGTVLMQPIPGEVIGISKGGTVPMQPIPEGIRNITPRRNSARIRILVAVLLATGFVAGAVAKSSCNNTDSTGIPERR